MEGPFASYPLEAAGIRWRRLMFNSPAAIHLGYLACALEALKPSNEDTRLAIAHALGMHWDSPRREEPATKQETPSSADVPVRPTTKRSIGQSESLSRPL